MSTLRDREIDAPPKDLERNCSFSLRLKYMEIRVPLAEDINTAPYDGEI